MKNIESSSENSGKRSSINKSSQQKTGVRAFREGKKEVAIMMIKKYKYFLFFLCVVAYISNFSIFFFLSIESF